MYGGSFLISDVVITLPSKPLPPPHRVDTVSIIKHLAKCGLKDIMAAAKNTYPDPVMDRKVLRKWTLLASLCTCVLCGYAV